MQQAPKQECQRERGVQASVYRVCNDTKGTNKVLKQIMGVGFFSYSDRKLQELCGIPVQLLMEKKHQPRILPGQCNRNGNSFF